MLPTLTSTISLAIALLLSLLFTPLMIKIANARGWIVAPRADRWHTRPTALMGGIAIFAAFTSAILVHVTKMDPWVLLSCAIMFGIGLYDDLREVKPFVKLFGQILASLLLIVNGYVFGGGILGWFGIPLTFLWVIGITNAINLLDNMDGLAAGITAIISLVTGLLFVQHGQSHHAIFSFTLAGACLGFLFYNFNPARIFMGDCGSLFLGFSVSFLSLALQQTIQEVTGLLVLLVPIGLMAIPIMDTTLVTLRRIISGRRIDQGGRDHTSHRLVSLGLSERGAVLLLYSLSAIWGAAVFLVSWMEIGSVFLILLLLSIFSVVFTLYLASIRVYSEREENLAYMRSRGENVKNLLGVRFLLMNKKLILGLSIDMMIVSASFLVAAHTTQVDLQADYRFMALLIFIRLLCFYGFDLYNRVWRYVATHELLSHLYAVLLSSLILFEANRAFGFGPVLTNSFFLIEFFITLTGLIFSRMIWRALREYFFRFSSQPKRKTLIYGAGDAGYILIREIIQNNRFAMLPVGFIDDDSAKRNMSIAGIKIYGSLNDFPEAVTRTGAEVVVVSMRELDAERQSQLEQMAEKSGVEVKRFHLQIQ